MVEAHGPSAKESVLNRVSPGYDYIYDTARHLAYTIHPRNRSISAEEASIPMENEAAPAGGAAASPERLKLNPYEGYAIKEKRMVKMDHRNSYIKWLLEWDKKPRPPVPNLPMAPKSMAAIKAQRAHDERVLADFKRDGYAYVQVDVFNDDDPRANLPDDQYDVIHHNSDEES
mgnify:CR=1 FL=1